MNYFILKIIFTLLIISICSPNSFSQQAEEISTDRPDRTESVDVVPYKFIQLETGFLYEKSSDESELKTNSYSFPDMLLRYGVYRNIELRLHFEYMLENNITAVSRNNSNDILPLEAGTKIKLMNGKSVFPETSFIFEFAIPGTASEGKNIKHIAPGISFLFENGITDNFDISYNLGINWDTDERTKTGFYTFSFGLTPLSKTTFFVESFGFFTDRVSPDLRIDYGVSYLISKNSRFDISSGLGLTGVSPDFFIGMGYSFRLPR